MPELDPLVGVPINTDQGSSSEYLGGLSLSLMTAYGKNPDYEAELARVAQVTGVPVDSVRSMPKELKTEAKMASTDFDQLSQEFPSTAAFLSDQQNADVAHDDMTVMQSIEKSFRAFGSGFEKGSIQDTLGDLNYGAMLGNLTEDQERARQILKSQMSGLDKENKDNRGIDYVLNQTGYTGRQLISSVKEGSKGAMMGATTGAVAGGIAGALFPAAEIMTVPAAATLGARAGFVGSSAVYNYKMEAGFAFDEFSDMKDTDGQQLPKDVAVGAAAAVGLINAGLETVGEIAIAKMFPGMAALISQSPKVAIKALLAQPTYRAMFANLGKKWVQAGSIEAITESLQELSTIIGGEVAKNVSGQKFDSILPEDALDRVEQAGQDAFVGAMGLGVPATGYRVYVDSKRVQQQKQTQEFIKALGDNSTDSKLLARMPEKFREFVSKVKEGGTIENVYITAERFQTFFQSQGVDPAQVAHQSGAINYDEAVAAHTDIVIPLDAYAENLAGSKFHQGLAPDIRLRQGDMTAREYSEYEQEREQHQQQLNALAENINIHGEHRAAFEQIKEDMRGQLLATGADPHTADQQATVHAKVMTNMAQRSGVEPLEFYKEWDLSVTRPMPGVLTKDSRSDINLDPLVDYLRTGKMPEEREIYGEGLSEFIKRMGGMQDAGETRSLQEGATLRPFERKLIQKDGLPIDIAMEKAIEAGYFPDAENRSLSESDFIDALDNDIRGSGHYSIKNLNHDKLALREHMNALDEHLTSLGIDLKQVTDNAEVRRFLDEASQHPDFHGQVTEFMQSVIADQIPKTINVDGIERSTRNSDGKPIAYSEQAIANFWHEYGDEVKVDENGRPKELYQSDNGNLDDKRGLIRIDRANKKFEIQYLEKANLSTFTHETGHFYLELLGDLAQRDNANEQIKSDYAKLLAWFGVSSRDQITTEHHEQWARANEAYFMEGKAPSEELRPIFQRFKAWMIMFYRNIESLNVKLTNEVRGVLDRLYASDEEIRLVQRDMDMQPMFLDAKAAGLTNAEFEVYRNDLIAEAANAKDALAAKLMLQMMRSKKAWWRDALTKMREEVAAEVDSTPVYKAFFALVNGKIGDTEIKLNKDSLVKQYGGEYVKRLPRSFQRIYTTKGGMDADSAASFLGFNSGDDLIQALVGMKPRNEYIKAEADVRMRQVHGDLLTDGTMADEARIALHNEQRQNVLMTELRALRRKMREVAPYVKVERDKAAQARLEAIAATELPPTQAFRDAARGLIGQTALRDLEPHKYLLAERKASRESFKAMAAGDPQAAFEAKKRELLNHFLYLEANKAKDEAEKITAYAKTFDKTSTRAQMGKAGADYLEQIDAILSRYEFKRVPLKALDRRFSLAEWVAQQQALGNEPAIPAGLLMEARQVNYRQASIDELRAVYDAVRNIEHLARLKNKIMTKQGSVEFNTAIDELVASAENNFESKPMTLDLNSRSMLERAGDGVSRLDAMLLKMEQVVEWLDGGDINGAWHTYLWNPIAEAQTAELDLSKQFTQRIQQSLEAMPKEQRQSMLDTFNVPGMGSVTRKFIISIAMNLGNEQNIKKLQKGFGWDEGIINAALARLNEHDIKFVQETLNTIESLWPQIAALEKRMTGLEPPKVTPKAFAVYDNTGNFIGTIEGYYPLVYDPRKSEAGAKQESGSLGELFEAGYVRATTPKGHTQARTDYSAPLMLDFEQVVTQHLAKVIKDLTHREAIVTANKVLTNSRIRQVLQETLGTAYEKQMLPWLRSVVNDRNGGSTQGLSDFSRFMMTTRANVVAATMGFKATTAIMQIAGIFQSLDMVQGKHLAGSLLEYLRHPVALTREVRSLSGEMRHRTNTLDRDIRDKLRTMTGQNSMWANVQKFAFHGIAIADSMVTVPTWMGAYRQAIENGADKETAILEGDRAVRLTQGSGGQKDLAAIQRNNELAKSLTMFYSYFSVLYARMRDMGHQVQSIKDMPRFLARAIFTVMIPAVLGDLLVGRTPKDDEDPALWAIRKMLLYPLMTIPLLRDIASSLDSGFDYKFSPIATGLEKLSKVATSTGKLIEGDIEWGDYALKVADTIGFVFGAAGTAQVSSTGKYLWRVSEGEESPDNLLELIFYAGMGKAKEH